MKRFAIILAVIVAVLAIAVAAVPFVVPSDFLKQKVADRLAALTGRSVTFSGEPILSIYPHVAISIDGLTIGNPKGMSTDPFIVADSLHTRLRLLPLLFGRAEFDEFELVKPTLHLVVESDGRNNWGITGGAVARQARAAGRAANDPTAAVPTDVQIGHLLVTGGTILYDDLVHNTREAMAEVDLDVMWPSVNATASGRGKLTWRGEPMEFTGLLAAPLQLIRGATSAARFAVASTPIRASFSGRASSSAGLRLNGDASISTPSMRRTIEWLGTPMGTGPILGAAAIRGTVSIGAANIGFTVASVELDGNSAEGSLGVSFAGSRPAVQGALTTDKLDLSAYLEAVRADLIATGSWIIAPARLAFAEAVDADVHLSAGQVIMGATQIGKVAATIAVRDGTVDVAVGEAQFYTGKIEAHLGISRDGAALAATAEAKVTDVPGRLALTDLAGVSVLDGTMDARLNLTARGRNWGEFAHALAGTGTLDIADGTLTGLDLAAVADALADPFAGPVAAGSGTTAFRHLATDFAIADSEIRTGDLFMEGSDFRLTLDGYGSVLSGALDAKAVLTTATETIPLAIAGTWHQPVVARELHPGG